MSDENNMTEKELQEEALRLKLLLTSGEATTVEARRYERVVAVLREITRARASVKRIWGLTIHRLK